MQNRKLKYCINWRDAWKKLKEERAVKPQIVYDNHFFKKIAQDFTRRIKLNDYEYGRKASELLKEIVDADYFAYIILRQWGRLVSVSHFTYEYSRNLEEEIALPAIPSSPRISVIILLFFFFPPDHGSPCFTLRP